MTDDSQHSTRGHVIITHLTALGLTAGFCPPALRGPQAVRREVPRAGGMRCPLQGAHGIIDRPRQPTVDVPEPLLLRAG